MARFVVAATMLAAVYSSTATIASASDDPETQAAIDAAAALVGARPVDVEGAMNTLGESDPIATLRKTGDLSSQVTPVSSVSDWPIGGAIGSRIYCVEGIESTHGQRMGPNPISVGGEHARGWLGYLPSTARFWGVQIGNRWSEWQGAAAILAKGERFARTQFYGIGVGLC